MTDPAPYDSAPEYRRLPGLSWSTLYPLAVSPAYYRHRLAQPLTPTPAMVLGTACHLATLEPDRYADEAVVAPPRPDRRTTVGKAACEGTAALDAALADAKRLPDDDTMRDLRAYAQHVDRCAAGPVLDLTPEQDGAARAVAAAVRAHPVAGLLLSEADAEVVLRWREGDRDCKGLADLYVPEASPALAAALGIEPGQTVLADLKTARDVSPHGLPGVTARRGYHGQLAYYDRGLAEPSARVLVYVETSAPYDVVVCVLDETMHEAGDALVSRLMATLADCEASDDWPGAAPGVVTLSAPRWAMPDDDTDLDLDGAGGDDDFVW